MKRLILTISALAGAWSVSSVGYFWFEPFLGTEIGYNEAPFFYAAYYVVWSVIVLWIFHPALLSGKGTTLTYERSIWAIVLLVAFAGFLLLVLPRLPVMAWTRTETPVEFYYANSWYFIPKSVEIIFQQILIAALVFALHARRLTLLLISLVTATLFGAIHLTLALAYDNPVYVLRYSVAATIFGAIVPYLILRMRNGLLISSAIHLGYYAVDITLIHFYFAKTALNGG